MKVARQLARLEPMVLTPLHGVPKEDWHRRPKGKWSVAQIVQHLSIGVDHVSERFAHRAEKQDMTRRASPHQTLLRHLLLGFGKFPPGIGTPDGARPEDRPDPELIQAQFRMGVERTRALIEDWPSERQVAVYVNHPILGDLNLLEWVRFHYVHCRHHARQIKRRLEWAKNSKE